MSGRLSRTARRDLSNSMRLPADGLPGSSDRGRIRHASGLAGVTPEQDQRSYGRVEGAVGRARDLDGPLEHVVELGADVLPRSPRGRQLAQFAVGPIVAHHPIEDCDTRERGNCGLASLIGRGREHSDPHGHAHVDLRVLLRRVDAGLGVVSCRSRERRNAGEPE